MPVLTKYELTEPTNIYAVYSHARHLSPKVRAFVDTLIEAFTPEPPWERDLAATRRRLG